MQTQVKEWGNSQGIRLPLSEMINISDAIQGIFEYI